MCSARVRKVSGVVEAKMPRVRRWNLVVRKERLRAERAGTVCHLSGFVTTRRTVVMAQMRRVSIFTGVCVAVSGTDNQGY